MATKHKNVPDIVALAVLGCLFSTSGCMTDVEGVEVGVATEALSTGLVWQSSSNAERYARCANDEVVTGFGGYVGCTDNFDRIEVACTRRGSSLDYSTEHTVVDTAPNITVVDNFFYASYGWVVVGIGGIVNGSNGPCASLGRIVFEECQWEPGAGRIKEVQGTGPVCRRVFHNQSGSGGDTSAEKFVNSHLRETDGFPKTWIVREHTALVGAGMISTNHNVSGIKAEFVSW